MVKFIKMKDRQSPCVALNFWNLRVLQGVTETEHQALQEGVGGRRKREAKSN